MSTPSLALGAPEPGAEPEGHAAYGQVRVDAGDRSLLWMTGEVDLYAVETAGPGLWEALPAVRTVDATDMTFMDSTGLRCLVAAMSGARARDERLTLKNPSTQVMHVLHATGLHALLDVVIDDS